jgi:hypothetical protein
MARYTELTAFCLALVLVPGGGLAIDAASGPSDPGSEAAVVAQGEEYVNSEAEGMEAPPAEAPAEWPQQMAQEGWPQASPEPIAPAVPPGQWVFTRQYGWIWMPFDDAYTYLPPTNLGGPYEYVYGPTMGWGWVVAPWILGWGPWPHFGLHGPRHFAWYGHGWWRTPSRWRDAQATVRGGAPFRGGGSFPGGRPAAPHGWGGSRGLGPPAHRDGAFAPRGGPGGHGGSVRAGGGRPSGGMHGGGRPAGGHGGGRHR